MHEIHLHTACTKQELNEEVICSFWNMVEVTVWPPCHHSIHTSGLSRLGVWADWMKWGGDAARWQSGLTGSVGGEGQPGGQPCLVRRVGCLFRNTNSRCGVQGGDSRNPYFAKNISPEFCLCLQGDTLPSQAEGQDGVMWSQNTEAVWARRALEDDSPPLRIERETEAQWDQELPSASHVGQGRT